MQPHESFGRERIDVSHHRRDLGVGDVAKRSDREIELGRGQGGLVELRLLWHEDDVVLDQQSRERSASCVGVDVQVPEQGDVDDEVQPHDIASRAGQLAQ